MGGDRIKSPEDYMLKTNEKESSNYFYGYQIECYIEFLQKHKNVSVEITSCATAYILNVTDGEKQDFFFARSKRAANTLKKLATVDSPFLPYDETEKGEDHITVMDRYGHVYRIYS